MKTPDHTVGKTALRAAVGQLNHYHTVMTRFNDSRNQPNAQKADKQPAKSAASSK